MFEINFPADLVKRQKGFDEKWLQETIKTLPFPIAYPLHRSLQENFPWHQILKDLLNAILQYMATLAISEYLESGDEPDFDINEILQDRMGRGICEGHWLSFIRICIKKRGDRNRLPLLAEVYQQLEEKYFIKISDDEYGIKIKEIGIISGWITLRNKFVGHAREFSNEAQAERIDKIILLLKTVVHLISPLAKYHYCHRFADKILPRSFDLTGIENFQEIQSNPVLKENEGVLVIDKDLNDYLRLYPLFITEKSKKGHDSLAGEIYLINSIEKKKTPEYLSPLGNTCHPKELKEDFFNYLNKKKVYEKREDIELERVYQYGIEKGKKIIAELIEQNLYIPDKYIERARFNSDFDSFISSNKKALIIAGESGSGKTSTIIHSALKLQEKGILALIIRCEGLPPTATNPDKLERTLTEELGFKGKFVDIIRWIDEKVEGNGTKICLFFEGMNEFVGPGKDLSRFFDSLNTLLSRYHQVPCFKLVFSTTSESLPYFLDKKNTLPESCAEERSLYFSTENDFVYSIGKYSHQELTEIAERYGIPAWMLETAEKNKKIDLFNPRQFRIFAEFFLGKSEQDLLALKGVEKDQKLKAISREYAKLSHSKLGEKHITQALKKDKNLLKILEKMSGFMEKQGDMAPSWSDYERKAPELAKQLSDNGWEKLNTLKELKLVKEEKITGAEGVGEWKLAFAHDKVFELLMNKAKRDLNILRIKIGTIFYLFIGLVFIVFSFNLKTTGKFSDQQLNDFQNVRRVLEGPISDLASKQLDNIYKFPNHQFTSAVNHFIPSILIYFLIFTGLFFFLDAGDLINKTTENFLKIKADLRINYFINCIEKVNLKKGMLMLIYWFFILAFVAGAIFLLHIKIPNAKSFWTIIFFCTFSPIVYYLYKSEISLIKRMGYKTVTHYFTDNTALKRNLTKSILWIVYFTLVIGLVYFSIAASLPVKIIKSNIHYIDPRDPVLSEVSEMKGIEETIQKFNNGINKLDKTINYSLLNDDQDKELVKYVFFVIWVVVFLVYSLNVLMVFVYRKALLPILKNENFMK